jgi:anaerobic dimethyl sulfoxide reductase subunit A
LSSDESIVNKSVSRRSVLKWSGALAAAGVVGVGLGIGGELLIRPSTTSTVSKTVTSTASGKTGTGTATITTTTTAPGSTITVTPTPVTFSTAYMNSVISDLVAKHSSDTVTYSGITGGSVGMGVVSGLYKIHTNNGIITAVEPDDSVNTGIAREDSVLTQQQIVEGHLQSRIKANGYAFPLYLYSPDRILYPMQRTSPRGQVNGAQFTRITWTDAIQSMANMITTTVAKYGPNSTYDGYSPQGAYLGNGVSSWGDVSFGAEDIATGWILGNPFSFTFFPPPIPSPNFSANVNVFVNVNDVWNSKAIILWGWDPSTSGGMIGPGTYGNYILKLATEQKNIPAISVDVKYNTIAEILNAQWIPIRPGTDTAAFLAIAYVLFNENLWDQTFVNKFVEPTGFAAWKSYVLGQTAGPDGAVARTPAWAEPICGIPQATLTALAEYMGKNVPCLFVTSSGPGRQYMGDLYARTALYLQALLGNLGISGSSPPYVGPMSPTFGAPPFGSTPQADYGTVAGTYAAPALMKSYEWFNAVNLLPQLNAGTITQTQYDNTIGNTPGNPIPNIKYVFTAMSNSLNQNVNINQQLAAIQLTDYYVSAAYHMTPNAYASDLILPIAEVFEDYYGFVSYPNGFAYCPKLVEPQGEAMPMNWIYTQLGIQLDFQKQFMPNYTTDAEWDSMNEAAMEKGYNEWAASPGATSLGITIPSWSEFVLKPFIRVDGPATITPALYANIQQGVPFGTASGKIEFVFQYLNTVNPATTAIGGPMDAMAVYRNQTNGFNDPNVVTYPLVHVGTHNRYRSHSAQDSDSLLTENFRHSVWLNPADAASRGIVDNQIVRVFNSAGAMTLPAYVTSRIVPGTAWIFDAAWYTPDAEGTDTRGCPNILTTGGYNADGQDPHNELVQVEAL